jgi:hypothetical protein
MLAPSSEQASNGAWHSVLPMQPQVRFDSQPAGTGWQLYWMLGPTGSRATHTSVDGLQVRVGPQAVVAPGNEVVHVPATQSRAGSIGIPTWVMLPSSATFTSLKQPQSGNWLAHSAAACS